MTEFTCTWRHRTIHLAPLLAEAFDVSRTQARRWIESENALKIDGETFPWLTCCADDIDSKVLSVGRKRFVRVECRP